MLTVFVLLCAQMGWAELVNRDSLRFDEGALHASLNQELRELPCTFSFLPYGADPAKVMWKTEVIQVNDRSFRLNPSDWFPERSPGSGILLVRFGTDDTVWGVRWFRLRGGENWLGAWGEFRPDWISLPKGVGVKSPGGLCSPILIEVGSKGLDGEGMLLMPFEAGGCSIPIPGGKKVTPLSLPGLRSWRLADLGLIDAGFIGGAHPVASDRIWKLNPQSGNVDLTYWFCTSDKTWRSTLKGYQEVLEPVFFPGDVLTIKTRISSGDWALEF